MTANGASPLKALAGTGLVGGVLAVDVTERTTFSGAGPHMDALRRGFRLRAQGVGSKSICCAGTTVGYRTTDFSLDVFKDEAIAGTPRYTSYSAAGAFDSGTRFSDPVGGFTDNGPAMSYANGDFMRGAPAAVQSGAKNYGPNAVVQAPLFRRFSPQCCRGEQLASQHRKQHRRPYRFWSQTVAGLTVGTNCE